MLLNSGDMKMSYCVMNAMQIQYNVMKNVMSNIIEYNFLFVIASCGSLGDTQRISVHIGIISSHLVSLSISSHLVSLFISSFASGRGCGCISAILISIVDDRCIICHTMYRYYLIHFFIVYKYHRVVQRIMRLCTLR